MTKEEATNGRDDMEIDGCAPEHQQASMILEGFKPDHLKVYYARSKSAAVQPLLKLSGCVQLTLIQIDRFGQDMGHASLYERCDDESQHKDNDQDIDKLFYGQEENGTKSDSDVDK